MTFNSSIFYLFTFSTFLIYIAPISAEILFDTVHHENENIETTSQTTTDDNRLKDGILEDSAAAAVQNNQSQELKKDIPSSANSSSMSCAEEDNPYRVNVSHIESKGIGYNQGYTTLEGFFTANTGNYIPFVDLRGHIFNNGKWASNLGIGTRYVINPASYMIGGNFYYDYRTTNHFHYNQIGLGFEAFLSRWELRINGYLPVGKKRKALDHDLNWISFKSFSGHNILINENYTDKIEYAMRGFNFEVGVHPFDFMRSFDFYVGVGPYYFNAHDGNTTWGGKVRLKAEVSRYVYFELSNSYDHLFHNRFQGTLTLSYPFGSKKCYGHKTKPRISQLADNRMYWQGAQPVERQEIVVTSKRKKTYTKDPIAKDPTTHQPIFVVFVNNTNTNPTPNGTFENPYPFFSHLDSSTNSGEVNSTTGNVIYVFAGDGTSHQMDKGDFVMQDLQKLLGSGVSHQFNTTKGVLTVPAQTTILPHIAATSGNTDVIAVRNNNEISGFDIASNGTGGFATIGIIDSLAPLSSPFNNTNINNNNFINGSHGIFLQNMSGNVIIEDNTSSFHVQNAIQVEVNFPETNLLVENNNISLESDAIHIANAANFNVQVLNNNLNNLTGTGVLLINSNSIPPTTSFIARGNAISFATNGILAESNLNNAIFIIEDNTVSNTTGVAINISNLSTGTVCTRLSGNTAISSASDFVIDNVDGGILQLEGGGINQGTVTKTGIITPVLPCDCRSGQGGDSCP